MKTGLLKYQGAAKMINMSQRRNCGILHTRITDKIRVSTAAIYYPYGTIANMPNEYYQYETWCFSEDSAQKSFQKIHFCDSRIHWSLVKKAIVVHKRIANNLKQRWTQKTDTPALRGVRPR